MLIFILAGAGYARFVWWQKQQEKASDDIRLVERRPVRPPTPEQTATIVPVPTETIAETATVPPIAPTTITAPAVDTAPPAPMTITAPSPTAAQPLPVVVPRGDGRSRYDAMARDFAANPRGNFTVQIQILCEPSNLEKAMQDGGDRVWFVPQPIGARSCYRVFWGRYATREEAQRALAQVPGSLRDANSAVKAIPKG